MLFYSLCLERKNRAGESSTYTEILNDYVAEKPLAKSQDIKSLLIGIRVFCVEHLEDGLENETEWFAEASAATMETKLDMISALGYTKWPVDKELRFGKLKEMFSLTTEKEEIRQAIVSIIPGRFSVGYATCGIMDYPTVSRFFIQLFDTGRSSSGVTRKMFDELSNLEELNRVMSKTKKSKRPKNQK